MSTDRRQNALERVRRAFAEIDRRCVQVFRTNVYDGFLRYMVDMSHFDYYNCLLFCVQPVRIEKESIKVRPTQVSGYVTWQKKNRFLKKGSSGLLFLYPFRNMKVEKEYKKDDNNEYDYDSSGNIKTVDTYKSFLDMTTGTVFDIDQTDSHFSQPEEKKNSIADEKDRKKVLRFLREVIEEKGFDVKLDSPGNNERMITVESYSLPGKKQIIIRSTLSTDYKMQLMVYEYAYSRMYHNMDSEERTTENGKQKMRLIALSVSYMFSYFMKMDTHRYSFKNIEKWGEASSDVHWFLNHVQSIYQSIAEELEYQHILEMKNLRDDLFDDEAEILEGGL